MQISKIILAIEDKKYVHNSGYARLKLRERERGQRVMVKFSPAYKVHVLVGQGFCCIQRHMFHLSQPIVKSKV